MKSTRFSMSRVASRFVGMLMLLANHVHADPRLAPLPTQLPTMSAVPACPAQFVARLDTSFIADPAVTLSPPSRLLVCQSSQTDPKDGLARISIALWSADAKLLAQSLVPLDVEGQLQAIEQHTPSYILTPDGHALALTLAVRAHEVDYDKHSTELWLFWFDGKTIRPLFTANLALEQWPTQCADANSCQERIHETSRLVLQPTSAAEFPRLMLLKTREIFGDVAATTPQERVTEQQEYRFDGARYEPTSANLQ